MDINTITYFIKAYNSKSLSQAARELYISQQGLSKAIRSLETELGVPLFYRAKKGIEPTKFADAIMPYLLQISESHCRMSAELADLTNCHSGHIRVGIINGILTAIPLGRIISSFRELYPDISVEASIEYDYVCEDLLTDEKIDIAFLAEPVDNPKIFHQTVFEDTLCICVNSAHPLASRDRVTLRDFHGRKMLNIDPRIKMFHTIDALFRKQGISPQYVFAPTEIQDFWQLASDFDAISIFPENWFRKLVKSDDYHFARIEDPDLKLQYCIGYNNSRIRTPNEKLFYNYTLDYLKRCSNAPASSGSPGGTERT